MNIKEESMGEWLDGTKVVPFHVGVYQITHPIYSQFTFFCYWNGTLWSCFGTTISEVVKYRGWEGRYQDFKFRGLKEQP